jgi:hypothetical protein
LQNSVLKTLPHQATQLAHQAPQIRELNNEFLLAYNSLIPNPEFARVHQQMIQERRQQQQLAREEADLDQADPLPGPTTGGSPGGGSTAPISTMRPGLAAVRHQSIEGQGLSMPIIAIQNSEPQNKFIITYHNIVLENSLYYRVNNNALMCQTSTGLDVWQVVRRIIVPWAWEVKVMPGCGIPRGFWLKPVRSVDRVKELLL